MCYVNNITENLFRGREKGKESPLRDTASEAALSTILEHFGLGPAAMAQDASHLAEFFVRGIRSLDDANKQSRLKDKTPAGKEFLENLHRLLASEVLAEHLQPGAEMRIFDLTRSYDKALENYYKQAKIDLEKKGFKVKEPDKVLQGYKR